MGTVVPEFREMNKEEMNFFMGRFMLEARKQDCSPYPPRSLYLISCGLLRYLRDCGVYDKNFLDLKNLEFTDFRKILDARMKELLSLGYETNRKQAQTILPEDENIIWSKEVFGDRGKITLSRFNNYGY